MWNQVTVLNHSILLVLSFFFFNNKILLCYFNFIKCKFKYFTLHVLIVIFLTCTCIIQSRSLHCKCSANKFWDDCWNFTCNAEVKTKQCKTKQNKNTHSTNILLKFTNIAKKKKEKKAKVFVLKSWIRWSDVFLLQNGKEIP